ncbi:endolytic transglycosylase MltG [Streptomyces sp. NPDC020403]|uniref:endolytic transglycosylase MltG n=1 Tax=unclassified Streptomyces TaxID=2593676 RepID=UPI0033FC30C8
MTEYGRGPGSEPWHPEDPLYGDQGWAAHGQGPGQYEGQQQPPYAQDPYAQQGYQQDPYAQHQQQDPYAQHQQQDPYAQQHQQQDAYAQQYQQDPYAVQQSQHQHQQQYGTPHDPYAQQSPEQPQQYNGGWDTGPQQTVPYDPQLPYGDTQGGYGEQVDYYGTPEAYPPPQPPGHREQAHQNHDQHQDHNEQHQGQQPQPLQQPRQPRQQNPDWDPDVPQEETHPFFTGADEPATGRDTRRDTRRDEDEEDAYDDDPRASRRGGGERRGKGKKKSRNGCACLGVAVVLVGGLGGVTYLGYSYYQNQFGAAPDYAGSGTETVEVEIPQGALGNEIANILKKAGVVKSADAFISAQNGNPKGKSLQAGVYLLKKEMSAKNAVEMMLNPASQNGYVVPPGTRNAKVYEDIDARLDLKKGTTEQIARTKAESLGLPDWADNDPAIKDPLEGFLYPATYAVAKGAKPEAVLGKMVARANAEYGKLDLEAAAKKYDLDGPWQVLTVASLVQAEGKTHDDFRKMSEVIYNRLKPSNTETNQKLQFDSTFNYLKKQSKINIGVSEIHKNMDPYNTYTQRGLTPGPISNPGSEALAAALNPTTDGWLYFVATDGQHRTEFAKNYDDFLKLKEKFDALD